MGRLSSPPSRLKAAPFRIGLAPSETAGQTPGAMRGASAARVKAPWSGWYKLAAWRRLRLKVFLRDGYVCAMCGRLEGDTSKLTCDHRQPHRGDQALFWDEDNLQTLCTEPCHVKHKQKQEQDSLNQRGDWGLTGPRPTARL